MVISGSIACSRCLRGDVVPSGLLVDPRSTGHFAGHQFMEEANERGPTTRSYPAHGRVYTGPASSHVVHARESQGLALRRRDPCVTARKPSHEVGCVRILPCDINRKRPSFETSGSIVRRVFLAVDTVLVSVLCRLWYVDTAPVAIEGVQEPPPPTSMPTSMPSSTSLHRRATESLTTAGLDLLAQNAGESSRWKQAVCPPRGATCAPSELA